MSTTPVVTSPPPDTAQTTATTANPAAGPFSSFLDPSQIAPSTYQASQQRPSGYMGKLGKGAMIIDKFLEGMSKGRAMQYAKSRQKEADIYNRIGQTEEYVRKSDIDPALQKQQIDKLEALRLGILRDQTSPDAAGGGGDSGQGGKKKKKKDDQDQSPIVKFFHQAATNMLGPGAQASSFDEKTVRATLGDVSHDVRMAQSQTAQIAQFGSIAINKISKGLSDGTIKSRADIFKDPELAQIMNALGKTPTDKLPSGLVEIIKSIPEKAETAKVTDYGTAEVDGKQINVVRTDKGLEDGKGNPVSLDTIKPGSLRMGNESAPKPPTEKQVELDRAYASWSKTLGKDKLDDGEKSIVADLERTPNSPLSEAIQSNLLKQKGPKNLQLAKDQAIRDTTAVRESKNKEETEERRLRIIHTRQEIDKANKEVPDNKPLKAGQGRQAAVKALASVHTNIKDKESVAGDEKDIKAIQDRSINPQPAEEAADKWVNRAISSVRDPNNWKNLTAEQREDIVTELEKMSNSQRYNIILTTGGKAAPASALVPGQVTSPPPGGESKTAAKPQIKQERTPPGGEKAESKPKPAVSTASPAAPQPQKITIKGVGTFETNKPVKGKDGKWHVITGAAGGRNVYSRPATPEEIQQATASSPPPQ